METETSYGSDGSGYGTDPESDSTRPTRGLTMSKPILNTKILEEQFTSLGVEVDDALIIQCLALCTEYNLDEEGLVETWMAYSLSHLGGADPTAETLIQMERKELHKKDAHQKKFGTPPTCSKSLSLPPSLHIYNASHLDTSLIDNEDILETYSSYSTPKTKRNGCSERGSPRQGLDVCQTPGRSPITAFSPAIFSSVSENHLYCDRVNAGQILLEWGPHAKASLWKPDPNTSFVPKIVPYNSDSHVGSNALYMFEKISDEVAMYNQMTEYLAHKIMEKNMLQDPEPCGVPFQELIVTYGRILSNKLILGGRHLQLEGTQALSNGQITALEMDKVEHYALFPGQVAVVEATNPTGSVLSVVRIHTTVLPPLPKEMPQFSSKEGTLQLVVAAGPFTQLDTSNYQPLEDLMKYIVDKQPQVVILVGPFIDACHSHVRDGILAETFEAQFEKIINKLMEPLQGLNIQVIVIPSLRDVHHQPIFPTPPFAPCKLPHNMLFMPDPCTVSIQGLTVGVTSLDIIKDLGSTEVSNSCGVTPRLHRIASHILQQQCFYPLYPPPEDILIDSELFNSHAHLDVMPHILILPSELRHFATVFEGCLILNPEHLTRGYMGGTFARIDVPPPTSNKQLDFVNNISCSIVRI